MILIRDGSLPGIGTFGTLVLGSKTFCTVEREWLNNEKYISCVPAGYYTLEVHNSLKYPDTLALVGATVSHYPGDKKRYACLFHQANYPEDVSGCVGLGDSLTYINGMLGVTNSANAMREFKRLVKLGSDDANTGVLNISWRKHRGQ